MRYVRNLKKSETPLKSALTVQKLLSVETYWISIPQSQCFKSELKSLSSKDLLHSNSALFSLHPFIDSQGVLWVNGREQESKLAYCMMHHYPGWQAPFDKVDHPDRAPQIVACRICFTHHSVTQTCSMCRHRSQKPKPELMGQLPCRLKEWLQM